MAMEQMPQGAATQSPEGQPKQSGGATELMIGTDAGLSKVLALMENAQGLNPEVKDRVAQSLQLYREAMEIMLGKGKAAAQGDTPAEVGGASGAVPAM